MTTELKTMNQPSLSQEIFEDEQDRNLGAYINLCERFFGEVENGEHDEALLELFIGADKQETKAKIMECLATCLADEFIEGQKND